MLIPSEAKFTLQCHAASNGTEEFTTLASAQSGFWGVTQLHCFQAIMRLAPPLVLVPPQLGIQPAFLRMRPHELLSP